MYNTKLLSVLSTLNNYEWSSFRKYLLSQTGRESDNFEFFEFLNNRKNALEKLVDTESVREKYFPKFSSKAFLNMMSRLFIWLEEWISIEELKESRYLDDLLKIKFYNSKGLYKLANKTAGQLEYKINSTDKFSLESNWALHQLYHSQYYSDNPIKNSKEKDYLEVLVSNFHNNIIEQDILYLAELYNRSSIHNYDYDKIIALIKVIINNIEPTPMSKKILPLIELVNHSDLKSLKKLKRLLFSNAIDKSSELHTILSMYLISYSLKLWMKGIHKDKTLIGDLYDYGLSNNVLMKSGKIPMVRFHNMISTLSTINDYQTMNQFIEKWCEKVDTKNTSSTRALARAQNAFYHERYNEINIELLNIEFANPIQKTRALGLNLIGLYYEKDLSPDLLLNTINNFQRYLRRNKEKMSDYYLQSHKNLSKLILEMQNSKFTNKVNIDINHYKPLIYRTWAEKAIEQE